MNAKIYVLTALAMCIGLLLTGFPAGAGQIETSVTLSVSGVIQQTPTETYTYIISVSGSNYQMTNGTTGHIDYQSTNATQVINAAIGNLTQGGGSILFSSGTYNLNGSITGTNKDDITLAFENGATLFVANGMNAPAILLNNANNWLIQNPTINGNAINQAVGGGSRAHGVEIDSSNNSRVDGAYIYNVRLFGFYTLTNVVNVGIANSKITNCGWNGITLGGDNAGELSLYAINNEVAYCSDVGITNYGYSNTVQNNYIHDMNGTTGFQGSGIAGSQWGIGVEGGGNDTITGNTILNCWSGIVISATTGLASNLNNISFNKVQNSTSVAIEISNDFNLINGNIIIQWDALDVYAGGIYLDSTANYNTVTANILNCTNPNAQGIVIYGGTGNQITSNSINAPTNQVNNGINVQNGSNNTIITQNLIVGCGGSGIKVDSGVNTVIKNNDLTQVASYTKIGNSGTTTSIYTNPGYNPVGYVSANFIYNGTSFNYIVDGIQYITMGNSSTWVSATTYTNTESPKVLYISGGTVTAIVFDGQTLYTAATTCSITLQPGDTFSVTFSTTPTISVIGQ